MTSIFLGLGSNVRPRHHLPLGLRDLEALFGAMTLSRVYEGEAIGFAGAPFWNLVLATETAMAVGELQAALREIEYRHGRPANATRFSDRTLDIDILTYGDRVGVVDGVTLPRGEILERAFVLRPLAELAPSARHPGSGETYADLWSAFDQNREPLRSVTL